MAGDYSKSKHYDSEKGEFVNLEEVRQNVSFWKALKAFMFDQKENTKPQKELPVKKLTVDSFSKTPSKDLKFYWLGHSSMILEFQEKRFLFDPVLSESPFPFSWVAPKRFHQVPIDVDQLPHLDAVLISHNHFDHLDKDVIKKLKDRDLQFVVPLAVGEILEDAGVAREKITEMDWWQEINLQGMKLVFLPTQHFSSRGLFDRMESLWGSWLLIGKEKKIYFSGDTGYAKFFKKIGDKYGPIDLTFMEIAAYSKMWPDVHSTPEQAIQIQQDIKGKLMVPIHWASFPLAFQPWKEPIVRMIKAAQKDSVKYITPQIGEEVHPYTYQSSNWWELL